MPVPRHVLRATLMSAALAVSACGSPSSSAPPAPAASVGQALHLALPEAVRAARLTDSSGRGVTLRSLRGKVIVLSDVVTLCQETCPLDTANLVAAARQVETDGMGNRVVFLSVTVDPQRDTPRRLKVFRALYQPAPSNWLTLTGSPATLAAFWKQLGVFVRREPDLPPLPRDWLTGRPLHYDVTHSDAVIFLDRRGVERYLLAGSPHVASGAPIPVELRGFLSGQGRRNLNDPRPGAWTLEEELSVISWLVGQRV